MPRYEMLQMALKATWLVFVIAYGASIGSLINVVVYRIPRGISIVSPPSRCPKCGSRLRWKDNIPVLGWVLLRGRCRYCKAKISPEYPLVELAVGLLFALFFAMCYVIPRNHPMAAFRPEWFYNDALQTWPTFLLMLVLLGSLVAMTLVDAKMFMIPLSLTWLPAIAAVIIHPLHAAWLGGMQRLMRTTPGYSWAIPTPTVEGSAFQEPLSGWGWIGASIGGVLGLGIASLMLAKGWIRRSFADYDEWERSVAAQAPKQQEGAAQGVQLAATPDAVVVADPRNPTEMWLQYPHARREMLKELVFLAPAAALGMAGFHIGRWIGGVSVTPMEITEAQAAPLWLSVLGGVLMGYLVGGAVVWAVRIFGSLAFGKEAMGLGDVHLMAAVGACLGWIDATIAFFGAAFVGIAWTLVSLVFARGVKRAMPYGPFLAVSTMLVLLGKPFVEQGLSMLLNRPINIP